MKTVNRRDLKIQLNKLYERAFEEDCRIIEVSVNLLSKLPNFERLEAVGELELTTDFFGFHFFPSLPLPYCK